MYCNGFLWVSQESDSVVNTGNFIARKTSLEEVAHNQLEEIIERNVGTNYYFLFKHSILLEFIDAFFCLRDLTMFCVIGRISMYSFIQQ